MSHEPECPKSTQRLYGAQECPACPALRIAYKRGREDALAPVRELADKFDHEDDGNAVVRYKLAAARIWGAIKKSEQE